MIKKLNVEQVRFLCYLRDNHQGLGWLAYINTILKKGEYDDTALEIQSVNTKWISMINASFKNHYYIEVYGKPTKYLK